MRKIKNSIIQCSILRIVRLFFDILHGIDRADIPLVVALEFAIMLGYDGQLKQNSELEIELFQTTIDQLKRTEMTKVENALMWLYVKTWGLQGQHVIDKDELWNFGGEDLESVIMGLILPRSNTCENNDEVDNGDNLAEALKKLILEKFDNKIIELYQWAQSIHHQELKNIPLKVETKMMAFDESTPTAPDRLTGTKNIVAFRANGIESDGDNITSHSNWNQGT